MNIIHEHIVCSFRIAHDIAEFHSMSENHRTK